MTGLLLLGSLTARYGRIAVVEEGDRSKLVLGYAMTVGIGVLFLAVLAFEWSNLLAEGLRWTTGSLRGNLLRTGRTARWSPHRRAGTVRDRHLPRPSPRPLQRQPESDGSNGRGVLALPDRHLDRDIHLHLLRHHLTNQLHHLFRSHDHSTTVGTETTDTECAGHEPAGSLSARRLSSRRSRSDHIPPRWGGGLSDVARLQRPVDRLALGPGARCCMGTPLRDARGRAALAWHHGSCVDSPRRKPGPPRAWRRRGTVSGTNRPRCTHRGHPDVVAIAGCSPRRGDGNLLWATRRAPLATRE